MPYRIDKARSNPALATGDHTEIREAKAKKSTWGSRAGVALAPA